MATTSTGHTAANPKVLECSCVHEFQDQKYGKNKRLHNPRKSGTFACTVCGKVKS